MYMRWGASCCILYINLIWLHSYIPIGYIVDISKDYPELQATMYMYIKYMLVLQALNLQYQEVW